jgi:hypothetical protein
MHLCGRYRLDGRLICVGVVDVLPSCLSSVYLYYDPDFKSLSLGKFSALTEIDWVKRVGMRVSPALRFYYLGAPLLPHAVSLSWVFLSPSLLSFSFSHLFCLQALYLIDLPHRLLHSQLSQNALQGPLQAIGAAVSRDLHLARPRGGVASSGPAKVQSIRASLRSNRRSQVCTVVLIQAPSLRLIRSVDD